MCGFPFVPASPAESPEKIPGGEANTNDGTHTIRIDSQQEQLYRQARSCFEAENYSQAIVALRELLHDPDYNVRAWANIGACLYHLDHYAAAIKYLNKALALDPDFVPAQLNLANSLFALGRFQEASALYGRVIEVDATNDSAFQGQFDSLLMQGETRACELLLDDWRSKLPESSKAPLAKGLLLRKQGKNPEAIKALQDLLVSDPENARIHALISEILVDIKRLDDALFFIKKAIELDPEDISYHCTKANIHYFLSQVADCIEAYGKALALCPSSATLLLNSHLIFPIIPTSTDEINICRDRFNEGLSLVENDPQLELIPQHPIALHTFPLAYHNHNDRPLLERYMKIMERLAAPLLRQLAGTKQTPSVPSAKRDDNRIRIGFLSRYFYGHSNTIAFQGLIRHLDREKFAVVIIHVSGSLNDHVQEDLNACCDEVIYLSNKFNEVYLTLHSLNLDLLFFTDMGMTPYDFLIPMFRSCAIQITGWGIPHTSGNRAVDYYISSEGLEPADADDHYTESLIRLPGSLPCCFLTEGEEVPPPFPRDYFFLPSHCQLIGCLQSLHKIHPDFDLVMEEIARKNPDVIFVFVEDAISHSTELFIQRLSEHAPAVREQSLFLRVMGRGEYQALCRCMDLLLDPIYYGSGITFFEAALVGTPIITLEGPFLRSRTVSGGYREMGIQDAPIAETPSQYVDLTTALLRDRNRRSRLRSDILRQNHRLFNRMDYVRNFENFCLQAVERRNHPTTAPLPLVL